jgi:hypothetical protein
MTRQSDQIGFSETEGESVSQTPTPTKREYALRQCLGIGAGGEHVEPRSASEVAQELDISERTVRRWCNEEPLPLVEEWSTLEKWTLYACVLTRDREALEEYLLVQRLLERSESPKVGAVGVRSSSEQSDASNSSPHPFDGLDVDFDPW